MRIEVFKDNESFFELKADWEKIISTSEDSSIFQTWEWNFNWWQVYGVEQKGKRQLNLSALVAYDCDTVVGIAPLCFEKIPMSLVRRLVFLGGWQTDYCNFIIATGYHHIVVKAFIDSIENLIGIFDIVELKQLHSSFQVAKLIKDIRFLQEVTLSTYLELPNVISELEKNVSKTMIRNLKYYRRSLQKKYDIHVVISDRQTFLKDIEFFFDLHQRRWQMKGQPGALGQAEKSFHRRLGIDFLNKGYIKLFFLKANDEYIAAKCCYVYKRVMTSYLDGFAPNWANFRPGSILNYECIIHAIETGCNFYDFGVGSEKYKMLWHPKISAVYGWALSRKNLLSQLMLSKHGEISKMIMENQSNED